MNNASHKNPFDLTSSYIEMEPSSGRSDTHKTSTVKQLLVDVINPQPKSSKSFYARVYAAQKKQTIRRTGNSGRIIRQITKKAGK